MKSALQISSLSLAAMILLSACGREEFGDFLIRMWYGTSIASGDCAAGTVATSTIYRADTAVVYEGLDGAYFLDIDEIVLEGERDGNAYEFQGVANSGTESESLLIEFELDGDDVAGTLTSIESGTGYTCTETTSFTGVRIADVDLQYSM